MAKNDVRLAVLGVGLMGADHARRLNNLIKGAHVAVVSDFDERRAAVIASEMDDCDVETDPLRAIARDDVDGVVIATPAASHEALLLAAIERGRPAFCEKPLGETVEASRRVLEAERASGRRLVQLGFMRRFDAEYSELQQRLQSGEIGSPLLMNTTIRTTSVPPTFTTEMILTDAAVHDFDMARFLLGEEIESVEVITPRSSPRAHDGLKDPLLVICRMVSGAVSTVALHMSSGMAYETRTEVLGSEGALEMGIETGLMKRTRSQTREFKGRPDFLDRFQNAYVTELNQFVRGIREDAITGPSTTDGLAASAICDAAVEALHTGQRVQVRL